MIDAIAAKMVKYTNDECYGKLFSQIQQCRSCWISRSCEANYRANIKKEKVAGKPRDNKTREKKYKKTAKYREWF